MVTERARLRLSDSPESSPVRFTGAWWPATYVQKILNGAKPSDLGEECVLRDPGGRGRRIGGQRV